MNEESAHEIPTARRSRNRVFIFAEVLIAVAIAATLYVALLPKEPSYNGKPLSYWLKQLSESGLYSSDPKVAESEQAIKHIGTNAIPTLLRMARAKDSAVKLKLIGLLERQHLVDFRASYASDQHTLAFVGFQCLHDVATSAIPALIEIYTNSPSDYSGDTVDLILQTVYPASASAIPYWIPPQKRSEWYRGAARVKEDLGETSNALMAVSEAIKLNSTNVPAYILRASLEIRLKDLTAALADAKKSVELDPNWDGTVFTLALCKFNLKDFKGAEADFTTVIKLSTNDNSAYNYRGLARANLRNLDGAMADLNQAIRLGPNDASAYRNRSMVETLQREYESALTDVSKSIELDSKDPYTFAARGRIRNALKDYGAARADFDKAIEKKARDPGIYISRASANVYLNDFEKADADLETALQLGSDNAFLRVVRGFLKAKRGDDEGALADFEQAVELSPQMAETYAMLGFFQYKASQWTPALENCRKALQLHILGDRSDLLAYIWLIQAQTGREKEGDGELGAYLETLESAKTNDWEASVARFFSGSVAESDFLSQATTTAKRPSSVKAQVCESLYYAGMKRKLAGDKQGAMQFFQKCLDTKNDNNLGYMNAGVEMRALKKAD